MQAWTGRVAAWAAAWAAAVVAVVGAASSLEQLAFVAASGVAFVPCWISWVELQAVVDPVQQKLAAASLELVMELEQVPVQEVELGRELVPLAWIGMAPEVEAAGQAWEQGKEQGQVVVLAAAVA